MREIWSLDHSQSWSCERLKDWDKLTKIKSFLLFDEALGWNSGSLFSCLATSMLWLIASIVPAATSICSCWSSRYSSQNFLKTWDSIKAAPSFVNTWHQLLADFILKDFLFTLNYTHYLPILFLSWSISWKSIIMIRISVLQKKNLKCSSPKFIQEKLSGCFLDYEFEVTPCTFWQQKWSVVPPSAVWEASRGSEETDCICDPGHILLSLTQHLLLTLAALGELKTSNAASAIKIVV